MHYPESKCPPFAFDELVDYFRSVMAEFPDKRTGTNTHYSMEDVALGAFALLFTQSPSFLAFQRRMHSAEGISDRQAADRRLPRREAGQESRFVIAVHSVVGYCCLNNGYRREKWGDEVRIRYAFITRKHNLSTSLTDRLQLAQNFTNIESFSHLVRPKIRIAGPPPRAAADVGRYPQKYTAKRRQSK